jgi:MYXO-CTERM domain-containing protein
VLVVDRTQQPMLRFGYRVEVDDTQITAGDIPLPDTLTHQFFALRGSVLFEGLTPELRTFDPDDPAAVAMPLWISQHDVERAQKSSDGEMLGYDLSPLTPQDILETETALAGRWLRITPDDRRVPITFEQSIFGLQWNLRDVEPGLYTIAGYIFSPPYNGWEIRSGLVSIVDRERHVPAAVFQRIQESLFDRQGRRVRTCIDAAAGTRMRSYLWIQERVDLGWMPWGEEQFVESGTIEQCFKSPLTGMTGSVRLRVDLIAPDGVEQTFYSPDMLTLISGSFACVESDSICCPTPSASAEPDASMATPDASVPATADASVTTTPDSSDAVHDDGGCGVVAPGTQANHAGLASLLVLGVLIGRRRQRR